MVVNNLREQIVRFLWKVSSSPLSAKLSRRVFAYTAMAGDIKSIGNHIRSISALSAQQALSRIKFSNCGEKELGEVLELVKCNLAMMEVFDTEKVKNVIRREEEIDVRVREALDSHLRRFHSRECSPEAGPIFVEMLGHLERISDLCNNVAEYLWDIQ
jgi:phosphate:Na+ symporter